MSRDYRLYLDDILAAGEKVIRYTSGLSFDEFVADDKTFDAVVRNLQIIGEASARVPTETRSRYPDVPWAEIVGFRNIVVHYYFGVDETIIWRIVESQLVPLMEQVRKILELEDTNE
jgi:uncharacterized protein with HEPN domain